MSSSTFNFPNGIDDFQPILINDVTVVNADHVNDLRSAILEIQNALVGVTEIPYDNTSIIESTDSIKKAIERLDTYVTAILDEINLFVNQDGYTTRIDDLEVELAAHRSSTGPTDSEGFGVHGVEGQVVGTENTQYLSNKVVDSGLTHVGPKFIARGSPGDAGLRQLEVYGTNSNLNFWVDEQGNAFFAGDLNVVGEQIFQDIQRVQQHLIVDGYSILGDANAPQPTTINGNFTVNNASSVTLNASNNLYYTGSAADLGNGTGTLDLNFVNTEVNGNLTVDGILKVNGLTTLGDGVGNDLLNIDGNVFISKDLFVSGNTSLENNVYIGNNTLEDSVSFLVNQFNATVGSNGSGVASFNSNLSVSRDVAIGGDLSADGYTFVFGNPTTSSTNAFIVNAQVFFTETLLVSGDLEIKGNAVIDQNLSVGGNFEVDGNITLGDGPSILNVNASMSTFNGDAQFTGNVSISESTTLGSDPSHTHIITGQVEIDGEVQIGGGYQGNLYNSSNTNHGGITLSPNGDLLLDGKLTVKGPIDPISIEIYNDSSQAAIPFVINNQPDGNGADIFRIDASGNTFIGSSPFNGELSVTGIARLGNDLEVSGNNTRLGPPVLPANYNNPSNPGTLVLVNATTFRVVGQNSLARIHGNLSLGTASSNAHEVIGSINIAGNLTITGNINGVNFSSFVTTVQQHLNDSAFAAHNAYNIRFTAVTMGAVPNNVHAVIEQIAGPGWDLANYDSLVGHINSTEAHDASDLTFMSAQFPSIEKIDDAIESLAGSSWTLGVDDSLKEHLDSIEAHLASNITFIPDGYSELVSDNVNDAINELEQLVSSVVGGDVFNYILEPDGESLDDWQPESPGDSITITMSVNPNELPFPSFKDSGIKLTNQGIGFDGQILRFTVDETTNGLVHNLRLAYKTFGGYADDDFEIQLWQNDDDQYLGVYSSVSLFRVDDNQEFHIPAGEGYLRNKFFVDGNYYELRILRKDGPTASGVVINSLFAGPDFNFEEQSIYEETIEVVSGLPVDDNEITGPIAAEDLEIITLPLDSKNNNSIKYYVVGLGHLEVFLNGQKLIEGPGFDWQTIGSPATISNQIQINIDLEISDLLQFRIAIAGGSVAVGDGYGEANSGINLGSGARVFRDKAGQDLRFRTLESDSIGLEIVEETNTIKISTTGRLSTLHQSVDYTLQLTDNVILVDATSGVITITLPSASGVEGKIYNIKKIDNSANTVIVDPDGTEEIDESTSYTITDQYESITIISDGSEWWII